MKTVPSACDLLLRMISHFRMAVLVIEFLVSFSR